MWNRCGGQADPGAVSPFLGPWISKALCGPDDGLWAHLFVNSKERTHGEKGKGRRTPNGAGRTRWFIDNESSIKAQYIKSDHKTNKKIKAMWGTENTRPTRFDTRRSSTGVKLKTLPQSIIGNADMSFFIH